MSRPDEENSDYDMAHVDEIKIINNDKENDSDHNDADDEPWVANDPTSPAASPSSEGGQEGLDSGFPSMAAFLFGNIDAEGKLTDNDFLDEETKNKLSRLSTLLGRDSERGLFDVSDAKQHNGQTKDGADKETEPFVAGQKADDAEDFSDMDEAMTDESSSGDEDESDEEKDNSIENINSSKSSDDLSDKIDVNKQGNDEKKLEGEKHLVEHKFKVEAGGISSVKQEEESDSELMPPPPGPGLMAKTNLSTSPKVFEANKEDKKKSEIKVPTVIKPLAAMMPERYRDVDVRTLFPEFRENHVLRFSRLFPVRQVNKPKIWKNVKKRIKQPGDKEQDEPNAKVRRPYSYENSFAPLPEDPDAYCENQAIRFHSTKQENSDEDNDSKNQKDEESKGPKQTDWRHGPAQYWYDMLNLPEKVEDFDYNLKLAIDSIPAADSNSNPEQRASNKPKGDSNEVAKIDFPPDAFLMVTQCNWEEDVVWNGDDIKHKVLQKLNSKTNAAGWVPSSFNRTAGSFSSSQGTAKSVSGLPGVKLQTMQHKKPTDADDTWNSIFPVENEELAYGRWEDEVIWDHENMPVKLQPRMVSMDPNDDNIILGIPDDIDPSTLPSDEPVRKVKIIQKHVKKSRMLLNRSGIISVIEEESPPPPPKHVDKDPYNISNDEFYVTKTHESLIKVATGGGLLQHATPTVQLLAPFIPTHMGPIKLRQFHRWPMKRWSHGPLSDFTKFYGVLPLHKHMKKKSKAREAEREAAGGGDIFFMRTAEDTSGKDGELVLFEYIEEHPPLLGLVGMCSKIKTYYKRKPGNDSGAKKHKYGEVTLAHTSPFLGQMMPGQTIQAFENNLSRAPIYNHNVPPSDFIIIRTRNEYSIRECDAFFMVGQECPLYEVPGPNSKRANNFTRDFLQVFIYRLFWRSRDNPRRIKMDEIKKAFPAHSESSIRKRLKPCAEFHRTGHDSNWWVIKNNFRLPTEDEIRAMVNPEQCCSFFSMIAAEQRLRDAGYGEKSLIAQQDDDDEESAAKLDDEVKVAPWNTTRAYILAMKGKCLLQLTGPADPTGHAGEGFSYVRIPNKPTNKEEQEQQPKRTVTGTDADLRKLPLKDARNILRKNGVPEKDIMRLSRWEVIDVVRTLSTEKVKAGDEGDHKFSRGNRFSIAEHQERYREECQRIFDVQNKVLASNEVLSSDEAESSEDEDNMDEDLDEMGKSIENMLSNKKSSSQILREREEMERKNLMKTMSEWGKDSQNTPTKRKKDDDENSSGDNSPAKVLKITRTYRNHDGKMYTRTELVRKPVVADTYVKIRTTKDETFIKQFATLDEAAKEEMKKEKRRIQEQLRRIRRNEEKERLGLTGPIKSQKDLINAKKKLKHKPDLKLKCGACGETGHMKTNKACPKYVEEFSDNVSQPLTVAMTEKDEEEKERRLQEIDETEQLVNVDGTKVRVSGRVVKHVEELRREAMMLKIPKKQLKEAEKEARKEIKRRRAGTVEHCDYLKNKRYQTIKRRRTDPLITFASYLEKIHSELRVMDEALQFLQPVNPKKVPDYLDKIQRPMDLQTIRENIQQKRYHSREEFLADINQILENSSIYNGPNDIYTSNAQRLLAVVSSKFTEKEENLMRLEKAINPLLDDNDQVALTYILDNVLNDKIKSMQESWPFMKPVNKKQMKHYYDMIKEPMDLETIGKRVSKHMYHTRDDFLRDIDLIHKNSIQFNGPDSEYTLKAQKILDVTNEAFASYADYLTQLEEKIREVQQRAIDQADVDSLGASLGELEDQRSASQASDLGGMSMPAGGSGMDLSLNRPMKRGRGRPRKHPNIQAHEMVDVTGEGGIANIPSRTAGGRGVNESESNLMDDLQFSDSDMSDEVDMDDEEDWEDVDVAGGNEGAEGISVTVDTSGANNDEVGLFQNAIPVQNMHPVSIAHNNSMEEQQIMEEEVVDEDYDPTDFLQNIGKGNGNEHVIANNHQHDGNFEGATIHGAIVAGTIDVPTTIGNNTGNGGVPIMPMVINALPPPEEGGPQAPANYTIVDSHHSSGQPGMGHNAHMALPSTAARAGGTIEDDLDISDDSDDGGLQESAQGDPIPIPAPIPFPGNQPHQQLPPGAMSVRVQEDDEIWF